MSFLSLALFVRYAVVRTSIDCVDRTVCQLVGPYVCLDMQGNTECNLETPLVYIDSDVIEL